MKKIIFIILLLSSINVKAIENIEINNENVIPSFDKSLKKYNFYTDKKVIRIEIEKTKDEIIKGEGVHYLEEGNNKIIIESSNNEKYELNIFYNYQNNNEEDIFLEDLIIKGYDIDFDKDKYEYDITINDENNLDIDYELSNDNGYVCITGNGNFNKTDNLITINVNNKYEYTIHVFKTINVSKIDKINIHEDISNEKKEIVILTIITISCILVFLFFYISFINKTTINI